MEVFPLGGWVPPFFMSFGAKNPSFHAEKLKILEKVLLFN